LSVGEIRRELRSLADAQQAKNLQRFFKTGPGQYGEGDVFLGIKVPTLRKLAGKQKLASVDEVRPLLESSIHEERFVALLMLISAYARADDAGKEAIYRLYLGSTAYVNNWDLVDTSAEHIVGAFLWARDKGPLSTLARSACLWERRIAVISTFHFIKRDSFEPTLRIAEMLLSDGEDLIHKAVGWMLREVGKRDIEVEERFLRRHYKRMPRTMLRYAIERFPESKRQAYLKGCA
jgi:3-methyladenine DNA glycosylase AlkD